MTEREGTGEGCWQTLLFNRLSASKHWVGLRLVGGGFALGTVCHDSCLEMMEAREKGGRKEQDHGGGGGSRAESLWNSVFLAVCAQSLTETETTSGRNKSTKRNQIKLQNVRRGCVGGCKACGGWLRFGGREVGSSPRGSCCNWIPSILSCPLRLVCGLVSFHAFMSVQRDRSQQH